jgi:hypothetical protein
MSDSGKASAAGREPGDSDGLRDDPPAVYEPPRLIVIGTVAELTRGSNPTTSDGLGPGSAL